MLHKIESNAEYDPVREEWLLIRLNFAGNVLVRVHGGAADACS